MPSQRPKIHLRVLMISITIFRNIFLTLLFRFFLKTFKDIWETGNWPKSWTEATIISVPKHGKDNTNPNSYRHIALTSCICKTLERMIDERLVWVPRNKKYNYRIPEWFQHQRSTNDHVVR